MSRMSVFEVVSCNCPQRFASGSLYTKFNTWAYLPPAPLENRQVEKAIKEICGNPHARQFFENSGHQDDIFENTKSLFLDLF